MDLPEVNYTDQYVAFCQRANLPINEVPEAGQKMEMSYEVAMKSLDPHLYQNLMKPDPRKLKADVRSRYEKGIMWTSDADEYEAKGFCGIASNIRQEMAAAREMMMENEIKASYDGKVKEIHVSEGQALDNGVLMLDIDK